MPELDDIKNGWHSCEISSEAASIAYVTARLSLPGAAELGGTFGDGFPGSKQRGRRASLQMRPTRQVSKVTTHVALHLPSGCRAQQRRKSSTSQAPASCKLTQAQALKCRSSCSWVTWRMLSKSLQLREWPNTQFAQCKSDEVGLTKGSTWNPRFDEQPLC